jgi:hypothetical protein
MANSDYTDIEAIAVRMSKIHKGKCVFCNSDKNLVDGVAYKNIRVNICPKCMKKPSMAEHDIINGVY